MAYNLKENVMKEDRFTGGHRMCAGCGGSILNILEMPQFNHQVQVTRGVLAEECTRMLTTFFQELRVRNKLEKEKRKERSS